MNNIVIRRAVKSDYEVIGRLLGEILEQHRCGRPDLFEQEAAVAGKYTREEFDGLLADEKTAIFSAVCGEEVVGYLISKVLDESHNPVLKKIKTLYIDDLCVTQGARRIGAGKELMKAAEEHARAIGCHNITLNVWGFNENAQGFYRHLGYSAQRMEMEKVLD